MLDKREWVRTHSDHLRRALMLEPRGHADMYGGFLTEPVSETADLGVIFMQNVDYSPHCGHGIVALATAAVELGWVDRTVPETRVGIDAPCGFIEAFVAWDGRDVGGVRFINVPSFVWMLDASVDTPSFGTVTVRLVIVDADALTRVTPLPMALNSTWLSATTISVSIS